MANHVHPCHAGFAGGGSEDAGQHLDGRGLAGAIGANQPENFALLHRQVNAAYGFDFLVVFGQSFGFDERFGHNSPERRNRGYTPQLLPLSGTCSSRSWSASHWWTD